MSEHVIVGAMPRRIDRRDVDRDVDAVAALHLIGEIADRRDETHEIDGLVIGARQFGVEARGVVHTFEPVELAAADLAADNASSPAHSSATVMRCSLVGCTAVIRNVSECTRSITPALRNIMICFRLTPSATEARPRKTPSDGALRSDSTSSADR